MKIGVKLPTSGPFASADMIKRTALECEELGFDSLWVHDHVNRRPEAAEAHFVAGSRKAWAAGGGEIVPNCYESLVTLSYCAGLTERLEIGTSVLVLPLRNPVWLAKWLATMDQYSGGRLTVGLGIGGYTLEELGAIGDSRLYKGRGRVFDEWVEIMRGVWAEHEYSYQSEFIDVSGAVVYPKPVQTPGPPLWYGGFSPKGKDRVAKTLDGWMPMFLSPSEITEGIEDLHARVVAYGRDPGAIGIGSEHWLSIDADSQRAWSRAEETRRGLWEFTEHLPDKAGGGVRYGRKEKEVSLLGNPDEIAKLVDEYKQAGVDHLICRVIADDFDEMLVSLRLFSAEVLAVRA